jgi:hypothetical protein
MDITKTSFHFDAKDYEIRISLENSDLAHGDFCAEAYLNGKLAYKTVRENAMQALAGSMENGKSPFDNIVTVLKYNIRQDFNKA